MVGAGHIRAFDRPRRRDAELQNHFSDRPRVTSEALIVTVRQLPTVSSNSPANQLFLEQAFRTRSNPRAYTALLPPGAGPRLGRRRSRLRLGGLRSSIRDQELADAAVRLAQPAREHAAEVLQHDDVRVV